ncbi:carbohydrate kinase family protein [bacterium]|nr:carbohydrate kinase family protein [bacterium]
MYDMITVGDIKLDTFVVLNDASVQCQLRMPECLLCLEYGAKIIVPAVVSEIAGTAPNVARGLARFGRKTAVLSNMGKDGTRHEAFETLKKEHVSTSLIREVPNEASAYSVILNFKGEKTALTSHVRRAYRLPKPMPKTKWLYVSEMGPGYENLYRQVAALGKKNGVNVVLNPGTIQLDERKKFLFDLLRVTYVLFVNLEEAQKIVGETTTEVHHLAAALYQMGPKQVVITDGKDGAYAFEGKHLHRISIFPGRLVEATGAGDAFSTGYLGALMNDLPHKEALRWGAVNSASVVGFVGPTKGLLTDAEIKKRLKKHPSFKATEM